MICFGRDCDRDAVAKGMCLMHYKRHRNSGDLNKVKLVRGKGRTTEERFWSRVALTAEPERCWLWLGSKTEHHYGHLGVDGKNWKAPRYAWFLVHGEVPQLHVLHKCDNPPCVNPNHLFLGTQQDNVDDMIAKGRNHYGERTGGSKLTEAQVREILTMPKAKSKWDTHLPFRRDIAKRYGISVPNVQDILHRHTWRHVQIEETGVENANKHD